MRVVLVGDARARAGLQSGLAATGLDVVGEAPTMAEARALGLDVDALLVAEPRARERAAPIEHLTPRELDVLQILAEGLSNKAIARRLGISDQTVKFHLASLCGKLGAQNRTDAVRLGIQRGLITV